MTSAPQPPIAKINLAALAKSSAKAKSAGMPPKEGKALSAKAQEGKEANEKWERPNLSALCRKLAGGDMAAGMFLFHVLFEWRNRRYKLDREGKRWLAHQRGAWAEASGLTFGELVKRALPRLKEECEFLDIEAKGNGPEKRLWISVDEAALQEAVYGSQALPWEMFWAKLKHAGPGHEKLPANAYAK